MATLSSYVPAGTVNVLVYAVVLPTWTSSVAAQAGSQSPAHPSSDCSDPTSVAVRGAGSAACAGAAASGAASPETASAAPARVATRRERPTMTAPLCGEEP